MALHILGVFSFLLTGKACGVQLNTQGLFYLLQVTGFYGADSCMRKPPGGLKEDSFLAAIVVFI
jgi:hypothetical protein